MYTNAAALSQLLPRNGQLEFGAIYEDFAFTDETSSGWHLRRLSLMWASPEYDECGYDDVAYVTDDDDVSRSTMASLLLILSSDSRFARI
ncbi:hypothetical protein PsorP6_015540 [Peronosclerospora sorghi]|uniref:Uncharacterized protein n=1 Tax=Peronosclerospora sorghi TaxID=230839 RepID=A0ACC0WPN5_9STRA|nr:hypothetical protein PsorP6_015540 [Peronosclerospora sorghi]